MRALLYVPESRPEMWIETMRSYADELLVDREEIRRRRLRRGRQLGRGAQPAVELGRAEVDVVAQALVAETDVERDDPPVGKALDRLREVGRRVEHDRGVVGVQLHQRRLPDPAHGLSHRGHDLVQLLVLRQTGDGSRLEQGVELARLHGRGQDHDPHSGCLLVNRRGRLHAVEPGQPVVHQHDVRPVLPDGGDRLGPVADRSDDVHVGAQPEEELECLAEDGVVLDEHDPNRRRRHSSSRSPASAKSSSG